MSWDVDTVPTLSTCPFCDTFWPSAAWKRSSKPFTSTAARHSAIARFLPGLRSPIFITAGIFRVSRWKMLVYDGGAALVSVPIWVFVGYAFGENIPQILEWVDRVKVWLFLVGVIAITIVVLRHSWLRLRVAARPESETLAPPAPSNRC